MWTKLGMRHGRWLTLAAVAVLTAAGCANDGTDRAQLPAGVPPNATSDPADVDDDAAAGDGGDAGGLSPQPDTTVPDHGGLPETSRPPVDADADDITEAEAEDAGELEDGEDAAHLEMFPEVDDDWTPQPLLPTEPNPPAHDHDDEDLPQLADPDDPYPIAPPDVDEVDSDDAQQVAEAWACNWFAADEAAGAGDTADLLEPLSTDALVEVLEQVSGSLAEGEWFESEVVRSHHDDDTDGGQVWTVDCHVRQYADGQMFRVAYERPVTVTLVDTDDGWLVDDFSQGAYADWLPEEIPPGH